MCSAALSLTIYKSFKLAHNSVIVAKIEPCTILMTAPIQNTFSYVLSSFEKMFANCQIFVFSNALVVVVTDNGTTTDCKEWLNMTVTTYSANRLKDEKQRQGIAVLNKEDTLC